jgi:hypothetical protein
MRSFHSPGPSPGEERGEVLSETWGDASMQAWGEGAIV